MRRRDPDHLPMESRTGSTGISFLWQPYSGFHPVREIPGGMIYHDKPGLNAIQALNPGFRNHSWHFPLRIFTKRFPHGHISNQDCPYICTRFRHHQKANPGIPIRPKHYRNIDTREVIVRYSLYRHSSNGAYHCFPILYIFSVS